ncbi:nucleotidyltransferase family protein [uncultured Lamprocystis sp.]|uniref:nucleotidyltransferase family protein n=1 Tax=uncultured Lamprocystis sp. TaxID=543132 RepID=UPI0025E23AEE|nr:nucleotidyltransferase domain-containing protein [uncultured Lamprocystis sp.]
MIPDPLTLDAARRFLDTVASRYPFRQAWLFGSRARGNARPDSDLDIALLLDGPREAFIAAKLALDDLAYDILLETGIHIQPLPLWQDDWDVPGTFPNPGLIAAIRREGVPL